MLVKGVKGQMEMKLAEEINLTIIDQACKLEIRIITKGVLQNKINKFKIMTNNLKIIIRQIVKQTTKIIIMETNN